MAPVVDTVYSGGDWRLMTRAAGPPRWIRTRRNPAHRPRAPCPTPRGPAGAAADCAAVAPGCDAAMNWWPARSSSTLGGCLRHKAPLKRAPHERGIGRITFALRPSPAPLPARHATARQSVCRRRCSLRSHTRPLIHRGVARRRR